jgi:hypothetical protein
MSTRKPRTYNNNRQRRLRFEDDDGKELAGAGVLLYDSEGIWLVGEEKGRSEIKYTDPGGKYRCGDQHIFATAARELTEELYHTVQLTGAHIAYYSTLEKPIYVDGHDGKPVYICYPIHTSELSKMGAKVSPADFLTAREYTLKRNSKAPRSTYPAVELKKFGYSEITKELQSTTPTLSSRALEILRKSDLKLLSGGSTEHHFNKPDGFLSMGHFPSTSTK